MTDTMQSLQLDEWGGGLTARDVPVPEPTPGEVLIEVEATSVGLTVRNAINGDLGDDPAALPRIPGHEIVGRVTELGSEALPFDAGDRVAAYFYLVCGRCDACLSGHESLCANFEGFVGVATDGGYAEYVSLPAESVVRLPDDIDPVAATAVPDAIATPYHIVSERAGIDPGDDVLVLGAGGGVGIHLVQLADHFGGEVTAVDRVDAKLDRCRELGAAHTLNTDEQSLAAFADSEGIEYDVAVDFTGSMDLLEESVSALATRGRLVNLTGFPGRSFDVSPRELVMDELEVVGSRYCSRYELARSAELVAEGVVEPVVSEVVELDGVEEMLATIAAGELVGRGATTP
ncbi:alcohol dehydrogenase catalytic domain-containing protein [Halorarius halobius]|uniref:alcohol dehydrogenase catalytic domain-containing protein n=1 Tax=Halorarius halobius TaxID=2962671 RepID=UPI0020CD515C|nr:alcohol dehydrogenase catalytic domain-containing protein [Halorarius halobius]